MQITKTAAAIAVIAALGATGATLAAYARHRGYGGGDVGPIMGRLVDDPAVQDQLKLTADQITKLRTIRDDAKSSIRQLRGQAIKARADLRATMLDTKAARQDIEKSAAAVRDAMSAVSQEVTKRLLDARDVLSVDQREQLRSIIKERVGERIRSGRPGLMRWRRHRGPSQDGQDAEDGETSHDGVSDDSNAVN